MIYISESFEPVLLSFINEYHSNINYIFWPRLARAHHSKETQARLNEKVIYVPKHLNPPNVPQARPIEYFWGFLTQKVYEVGWEAKTKQELR